jgi:cytochrome P450
MEVYYDPYDYVESDPYAAYSLLREHAPVYLNKKLGAWVLSRHADVREALRDYRRFSSTRGISIEPSAAGPDAHLLASVVAMDPPDHLRIRRVLASFFSRSHVARLEPRIRDLTRTQLDIALRTDHFDFIGDYVEPLPMRILCSIMGVSEDDTDMIRHLSELLVLRSENDHDLPRKAIGAIVELRHYYRKLVAGREHDRRDDLVSFMLGAADEGILTHEEIVAFFFLLTSAGNDSPTQLLGNAWYWAWRNPDQRRVAFNGGISPWIEETLRYDTPTQVLARTAPADTELHGALIPAGARVLLLLGSANRDPAAFPDPDRYDLGRDATQLANHLVSFGSGLHLCLGQHLLNLQARVALEEAVARIADFEIDEGSIAPEIKVDSRGFKSLPTTVQLSTS